MTLFWKIFMALNGAAIVLFMGTTIWAAFDPFLTSASPDFSLGASNSWADRMDAYCTSSSYFHDGYKTNLSLNSPALGRLMEVSND